MAKSSGAQRESGGVVVPEAARKGAVRRKGPDFGHAGGGGKRKGMSGTTRTNHPHGHELMDNVRKLQRGLYVAAKVSLERRFHALYDRIWRGDVLQEAWRRAGRLLERGIRRYYLHRWPSARSMKKVRQRVKELTGSTRNGVKDVRVLISDLNPILRGWGNYFRTGNAANKFNQMDRYVFRRLGRFMRRRKGRHLRAGECEAWTREWFWSLGLHRHRGTVRYPEAA